ncbi:MAG: hypothetical protein H7195_06045 [Chryseobacterium sp.]|nr:hypothetical protein [Chryseobacterium sp.]
MENILSVEDQNFLEAIYKKYGVQNIMCDENGVNFSEGLSELTFNESNFTYLNQIFKKLKYRLHANFRMDFSTSGFNINVIRN